MPGAANAVLSMTQGDSFSGDFNDGIQVGPRAWENEWYALAKIAVIKLAHAYRKQYGMSAISLMPTNSLRAG